MTPTVGATYETTRGIFKVLELMPASHAVLVRRSDGRAALITASDWDTWLPRLVVFDAF